MYRYLQKREENGKEEDNVIIEKYRDGRTRFVFSLFHQRMFLKQ